MILELAAADLGQIVEAFWRGSLGSSSALFSGTLVRAIPLAIIGVGLALSFRAGVFNIGAEGQLLLGAIAATIAGSQVAGPGPIGVIVSLGAACVAGAGWAAIAGILRWRFGVLEVISTIMLNFVAANLVSYLVRGPLQEPTHVYPQTDPISEGARLPQLWSGTRLHAGIIVATVCAVAVWWFLSRTAAGFRIRAVGASPTAARSAGQVSVERVTFGALVASGALAGLAGGIEVSGVTYALYENLSPGYGFSAIAVAILAGLRPLHVLGAAFLFAALETGALGMQRDAGVPSVVALALEALIILAVVGVAGFRLDWKSWPGLRTNPRAIQ